MEKDADDLRKSKGEEQKQTEAKLKKAETQIEKLKGKLEEAQEFKKLFKVHAFFLFLFSSLLFTFFPSRACKLKEMTLLKLTKIWKNKP